mmetsp:Transcript_14639/g.45386  ORF Transcript_14639/g.45386 Transcript_14639/m.45386 type:complete len:260 (-) Transcript_14639:85-864(-)
MFTQSTSAISPPIDVIAFSYTRSASGSSSSRTAASSALTSSASRSMIVWRPCSSSATREYLTGSPTSFPSSGKCQPYHSLTRMPSWLTAVSMWSSKADAWMIMLSLRWTLNLTLLREKACARPHWARMMSPASWFGSSFSACTRRRRMSSVTDSLETTGTSTASWIAEPSFGSATASSHPSLPLALRFASAPSRNSCRNGERRPSDTHTQFSRAISEEVKGAKETSFTYDSKAPKDCSDFCSSTSSAPISSFSTRLNRA